MFHNFLYFKTSKYLLILPAATCGISPIVHTNHEAEAIATSTFFSIYAKIKEREHLPNQARVTSAVILPTCIHQRDLGLKSSLLVSPFCEMEKYTKKNHIKVYFSYMKNLK